MPFTFTDELRIKVVARDPAGNQGIGVSQDDCSILTLDELAIRLDIQEADVEYTPGPPEEGFPEYPGVAEPRLDPIDMPTDGEPDEEELLDDPPPDADGDGIRDDFERILARSFDPFYVWSNDDPNNFCFLADRSDELQCTSFVSHTTPLVYYRVHFISVRTRAGVPIQRQYIIDYLTIWDHNAGLCTLAGASSHQWDVERTAFLVVTTVTDRHSINIRDYFLVGIFLSAHENVTCFDNSLKSTFESTPIPAGNHLIVFWSKGKHANYEFPPDLYPFWTCPPAQVCFVIPPTCIPSFLILECFAGGAPGARATSDHLINVGELGRPINGSSWVNVDKVRGKLEEPVIKLRNIN